MSLHDFNINIINYYLLTPMALITLGLAFLEKRKSHKEFCRGRPGLITPFRFLDGYNNRVSLSLAFGTTTNMVIAFIYKQPKLEIAAPLWLRALVIVYLQACIVCILCFPLFACITTKFKVVGSAGLILYCSLWLSLNIVEVVRSFQFAATESSIKPVEGINDTTSLQLAQGLEILRGLPIIACYIMLIATAILNLYRCFKRKSFIRKNIEGLMTMHQKQHMLWVFQKSRHVHQSQGSCSHRPFYERIIKSIKMQYFQSVPFFKYPTRVVAVAFMQLNLVYWIGLLGMFALIQWALFMHNYTELYEWRHIVIGPYSFSVAIAILVSLSHIFLGLRAYRRDILQIYRGDRSHIPDLKLKPQTILTRSMRFPGYQLASSFWGFSVLFLITFLVTFTICAIIYGMERFDVLDYYFLVGLQYLCFPVTLLAIYYLQVFMTKKVLLQDKLEPTDHSPPLNVDNRKLCEIISYYFLFANTAVGFFSCILRILKSAGYNIFFLGRTDMSLMTRDMEIRDNGYVGYVCMLLVDNAHNNPCMRVFTHYLWSQVLDARLAKQGSGTGVQSPSSTTLQSIVSDENPTVQTTADSSPRGKTSETLSFKRARTRWALALTLTNNPDMKALRKRALSTNLKTVSVSMVNVDDTTSTLA